MTCFIALVRAANVGGTGKLPMADLRKMGAAAGFRALRTYLTSGNLIFESDEDELAVKTALEKQLLDYAGKTVSVLIRTAAEMAQVLAENPFPTAPANHTVAIFLDAPPLPAALVAVSGHNGEKIELGRREIYVHYSAGIAGSRLNIPAATHGTARNMNTVAKLAINAGT